MRKFVSSGLFAAIAFTGATGSAHATDRTLELSPPKTRASFGSGYSSVEQEFRPQTCVSFGEEREQGQGGGADAHYKQIMNNSELADEMSLGVQAGFKVSMGVAGAQVDSKVNFLQKTQTNFFSQTILAVYKNLDAPKFIKGDIKLRDEYKSLKPSEFKQKCGDYLVLGMQEGSEFYGTVQYEIKDSSTLTDFSTSTKASGFYGPYSANLGLDYARKNASTNKNLNLTVNAISTGGNSPVTTIAELEAEYKAFPSKGKKNIVKIIAVPYEEIVADWPMKDPLAPMTSDEKLDKLATVAFAHISLITDLKFMKHNEKLFALGSQESTRKSSLAKLEKLTSDFESALDALRKDAKGCDTEFSAKCESLFTKWEKWDAADQYEKLPQRYTSTCTGFTLKFENWKANGFPGTIFANNRHGKDDNFGNNKVKVTAKFKLKPKGKQLEASMDLKVAEVGKKGFGHINEDTYFTGSDSGIIFDLAGASMPGADLSKCSFGKPIVAKGPDDGSASAESGKGGQDKLQVKGKGLVQKMTCDISTKKNMKISCTGFQFDDMPLNLVSEQDADADKGGGKSGAGEAIKNSRADSKKNKAKHAPKSSKGGKGKKGGKKGK